MPNWGLDDFDDTPPVNESAAPTRELVPEGEHAFQIREVIDGDRVEIRLVHEDRRYGWVFANLPANADWAKRILSTLRKACGMSREEWASTPITDLVGRRVVARVYHKAGNGKTFVNVGEFKPAEPTVERAVAAPAVERAVAPPAPRATPARTATKKADAAGHDPDDIPFLWVLPIMAAALSQVIA